MTTRPDRRWLVALLLLSACQGEQAMLDSRGTGAERVEAMWWAMLVVSGLIYTGVLVLLLVAALRRRREEAENGHPQGLAWILGGGVVVPAIVLTPLFVWTLTEMGHLRPDAERHDFTIQVAARQYWWDVEYVLGGEGERIERVRTANEIRVPVGRRVRLELTSHDVIHSLWIPSLQGKTDLIPGRVTVTWLEATRPGAMRGQCAEFCGTQHARMALAVRAEPEQEFEAWLRTQRASAAEPTDSLARAGREVFLSTACAMCHAVRGTQALAQVAPDLTHVASRLTLAAGQLPNTPSHLASWVGNPQLLKPGSQMPRVPLSSEELGALLHYLDTLK